MDFSDMTYKEQYEQFFFPVCDFLVQNKVNYVIHTAKEEAYDYLLDNEYCCYIEIINPNRPDLDYGVQIDDEIIFFYNQSHHHIDIYDDSVLEKVVKGLLENIKDVIESRIAGYTLLCGDGWLLGGCADLEQLAADAQNPFQSADDNLTEPEFEIRLHSKGGKHKYTFWDPKLDREIEIPKREYTFFYYHYSTKGRHSKERFIIVNDSETENVVLINAEKIHLAKYPRRYMTISQHAVKAIQQIIRDNPCIMDFDDECISRSKDYDPFVNTDAFNSILFGDGTRENTISEFGLWRFEEQSEGVLKTVFECFRRIRDILVAEGVPEEFFAMQFEDDQS